MKLETEMIAQEKNSRVPWRGKMIARTMLRFIIILFLSTLLTIVESYAQNFNNTGVLNNLGRFKVKNQVAGLPSIIDGYFEYFGLAQQIPAKQYKNLILSGSGIKQTSGGNFIVTDSIHVSSNVIFSVESTFVVQLNGRLNEQGYLTGSIRNSTDLSGVTASSDFGNIGTSISWSGTAPGMTTVTRTSGVIQHGNGNESIKRYYDIAPVTNAGLNATALFAYSNNELNGKQPSKLVLWKSSDNGATWHVQHNVLIDTAAHTVTKNGISSFARWTLSDSLTPLGMLNAVPQNIVIASGNPQTGVISTALSNFTIKIIDAVNDGVENTPVSYAILSAPLGATGQSLSLGSLAANTDGFASASLTLSGKIGTYVVGVTSGSLPGNSVTFSAVATHGPASALALASGNNQSDTTGFILPIPLTVTVLDAGGNPVPGIPVAFGISTYPASAVGQQVNPSSVVTDSSGRASANVVLGSLPGTYTISASAASLTGSPVIFSATAIQRGNPVPVLASISPNIKNVFDTTFTLTVNGSNFISSSVVKFNGAVRATTYVTPSKLRAVITTADLANGGIYHVTVFNPAPLGGASDSVTLTVNNVAPVLSSISPSGALFGSDAVNVTITGRNFVPGSLVSVNGSDRAASYGGRMQLTIQLSTDDLASIGTLSIAVKNPAPGGGSSNSGIFTIYGSSISGTLFIDDNMNGIQESDEGGMTAYTMSLVGANPAHNQSVQTGANGIFKFSNLQPDFYTVTADVPKNWLVSSPLSQSYSILLDRGSDTTGFDFGTYSPGDTAHYRSFTMDSMATIRKVRKRAVEIVSEFRIGNATVSSADRLVLRFLADVSTISAAPTFSSASSSDGKRRIWEFTGGTLRQHDSVRIIGTSANHLILPLARIDYYSGKTLLASVVAGNHHRPFVIRALFAMPNTANVRDEIFRQKVFASTKGMIIGIPRTDSAKQYAWVILRRSVDVRRTLVDKKGYQSGAPRGFTALENGHAMRGRLLHAMPPSLHNNRLLGSLVTLKMNIKASALGITPPGFGELIFDEVRNPLSGLEVKEIAVRADTAFTYWRGRPTSEYDVLDSTIRKINAAFAGPIDTISYAANLRLTGMQSVSHVRYLHVNPNVAPVVIPRIVVETESEEEDEDTTEVDSYDDPDTVMATLPESFSLYQNFPNPFNPETRIEFDIPAQSVVTVKIYNTLGQEIRTLLNEAEMEAGRQSVKFNADDLPSGVYVYRMTALIQVSNEDQTHPRKFTDSKKMILVK